ncbi:hypothetical protein MMP65_05935 [Acinetobacter sp. ANC 3926]|uniref:hypothetical protein n=1 Tax=Acinetobacter genomosp. 15BJ TaxID=106651 RepID=UPI001F4B88FE|nr:hypothetical protein [Acinetobacter genomosp. 15BJ]MCH7291000.1 hypothetical protein [Acinetobacter genomosp. 15BJ]
MYMPKIDPICWKYHQMEEGLKRLHEIFDAELDSHSRAEIKPLTPRQEIKPCSDQTLKNRQKRLRKMNKKK